MKSNPLFVTVYCGYFISTSHTMYLHFVNTYNYTCYLCMLVFKFKLNLNWQNFTVKLLHARGLIGTGGSTQPGKINPYKTSAWASSLVSFDM